MHEQDGRSADQNRTPSIPPSGPCAAFQPALGGQHESARVRKMRVAGEHEGCRCEDARQTA